MHFTKVQISELILVEDLCDIFRTGQCDYTIEMVWEKWQEMCDWSRKDY